MNKMNKMITDLFVPVSDVEIYDIDTAEFYGQLCNICDRHLSNASGFDIPDDMDNINFTSDIARSLATNIIELFETSFMNIDIDDEYKDEYKDDDKDDENIDNVKPLLSNQDID